MTQAAAARGAHVHEVAALVAALVPIGLLVVLSTQDSQSEFVAVAAVTMGTLLCSYAAAFREIAREQSGPTRSTKSGLGVVVGAATLALAVGAAIFGDFAAGLSLALGVEVVYLSGFWRHWLFFLPRDLVEPRWKSWTMLALGSVAITLVFTALCAVLLRQGHIAARAPLPAGAAVYDPSASGSPSPFSVSFENSVWNVADAVPVLNVPQTLDHWQARYELSGKTSGWLLLGYKLLVLLPLLGLLGGLIEHLQGKRPGPRKQT